MTNPKTMREWNAYQAREGAKRDKNWPVIAGRFLTINGVYVCIDEYTK